MDRPRRPRGLEFRAINASHLIKYSQSLNKVFIGLTPGSTRGRPVRSIIRHQAYTLHCNLLLLPTVIHSVLLLWSYTVAYPLNCLEVKFDLLNFLILLAFLAKNVNFRGCGSVIFSTVRNFANLQKFSPIFIPEIAKTDLVIFEISLTEWGFLALSRIDIEVKFFF